MHQMRIDICAEAKPGVFKIDSVDKRPVERPVIIAWEQRNTTLLPDDLKNFFMTTNGFHLSWSVKMESKPLLLFLCLWFFLTHVLIHIIYILYIIQILCASTERVFKGGGSLHY